MTFLIEKLWLVACGGDSQIHVVGCMMAWILGTVIEKIIDVYDRDDAIKACIGICSPLQLSKSSCSFFDVQLQPFVL
jgi:hypothetical protein